MKKLLFSLVFLGFLSSGLCDLPVHCMARDVAGKWTFYMNSTLTTKEQACGHNRPDHNTDHVDEIEKIESGQIPVDYELKLPNLIIDKNGIQIGVWTMVYDEGFSIEVAGYSFFAFSKYVLNKNNHARDTDDEQTQGYFSDCSKTFSGWYTFNGKFGCFFGQKSVTSSNDVPRDNAIIFHGIQGERIVQRKNTPSGPVGSNTGNSLFANNGPSLTNPTPQELLAVQNGPIDLGDNSKKSDMSLFDKFQNNIPIYDVPHPAYMNDPNTGSDNEKFEPDYSFIQLVNSEKSKLPWKAKAHETFVNKTHGQMKRLIGMSQFKQIKYKASETEKAKSMSAASALKFSFLQMNFKENERIQGKGRMMRGGPAVYEPCEGTLASGLPKCFDWRNVDKINYDTPIKSQGDCGSCYAEAFLSALESRIRIKSKLASKPFLSTSNTISCSRTNQGCNGGYPWLVGKYGKEFGFVETSCSPFVESDNSCDESCFTRSKVWKIKKFGYIGQDFYGSTNEEAMLKELHENGPITIAFNAAPDLYYYSYGVFLTNPKEAYSEGNGRDDIKPWMFTNHAVVCVGWGETNHEGQLLKYWIFKNSWGEEWGEGGYFRILRGINLGAVENQAVYAEPEL